MGGNAARLRTVGAFRVPIVLSVVASAALVAVAAPLAGRADAALSCPTGVATSNAFGAATGWTEFVEGNGSRTSESEGAIAYGGNHSAGGMTVGTRLPSGFAATSPALVVAGTHGSYNLQKGSAYLSPKSGVSFNGGSGTGYLTSNPIDFATAFGQLRTLSTQWGAAAATGTVSAGVTGGNNALVLTGSSATLNVFDLSTSDAAALAGGRHLGLNVPTGSVTIINVPGATPTIGGQAWLGSGSSWNQANDNNIKSGYAGLVWNFPDASTVTVSYGSAFPGTILAPRAAVTIAAAGHTIGQVIAQSFVSGYETHQSLFPGEACVPSPPSTPGTSDVTIEKSASSATPTGGSTVTYTLTATNLGNATATGVVIRDDLPAGVTFVSAQSLCTQAGGVVTCNVGSLAPGAAVTRTITVTADPIAGAGASSDPQATHWLTPYKAEAQVDLEPGQQRTILLGCNSGDYLSDGQFRVDHVDQDTGTIRDVKVLSAQSDSASTWKGVIRNDAAGRAQAKAFVVCLPRQTEANGHRHSLSVDTAVVTTSGSYGVGRSTASVTCPVGTVPVAPGFDLSSASAELVGSEHTTSAPRKWTFTIQATASVSATFSARCLRTTVDPVNGHTHELRLTHVVRTVTVPGATAAPGNEFQVTCPDDGKGVVATFDLPSGVHPFGNDPRLKARAFRLFNDTGVAQSATLDLVCLHDRTGTEQSGSPTPVEVVNVATVSSTSTDANAANNAATATITVQPGGATVAASGFLRVQGARAKVAVLSSLAGKGRVKVVVGRKVVAIAQVRLRAGKATVVTLQLSKKVKRQVARAGTVRIVVDPARGRTIVSKVRVRR